MTAMSRRRFCALAGSSLAATALVVSGCSGADDVGSASLPADDGADGTLTGVSVAVRRDPG